MTKRPKWEDCNTQMTSTRELDKTASRRVEQRVENVGSLA